MRLSSTIRPLRNPPYRISLDEPLSLRSLTRVANALPHVLLNGAPRAEDPALQNALDNKTASVLIALCNVNNEPGVLLEVRGKLRTHSGEISFPGGKADPTDPTLLDVAEREVFEEIGVRKEQITFLGRLTPPLTSLYGLTVHCFIGFISPLDSPISLSSLSSDASNTDPLPSILMSSLQRSETEVSQIFHLPLYGLVDPDRLREHRINRLPPYWAIDVTDLIDKSGDAMLPPAPWEEPSDSEKAMDDKDFNPKVEVWGLTGGWLNQFMRVLGAY